MIRFWGNSFLGASFALVKIFRISQTPSLGSILKIFTNTKQGKSEVSLSKLPPQILELFIKNILNSPSLAEGVRGWVKPPNPSLRGESQDLPKQSTLFRHTERSEVSKTLESSKKAEAMTNKRINKSNSPLQHCDSSDSMSSDLDSSLRNLRNFAQNDESSVDCFDFLQKSRNYKSHAQRHSLAF